MDNVLYYHLEKKGQVVEDGAPLIKLPLTYAKTSAHGTYRKYSPLNTTPNDTENAAKYNWRYRYVHLIVSKTELLENSGKSQAVNLLKAKLKNVMATMRDDIGTDFFSTNDDTSEAITGLRAIVKASGTIGGLSSSEVPTWISDVDASTATLSLSAMEQQLLDASIGNDQPDIIVTTKGVYKKFWDLLVANQRFGQGESADAGFSYLLFNQIPVFWDSHCPGTPSVGDNHMFFLNSRWLYFYVHKDDNMQLERIGPLFNQRVHAERLTFAGNLCTDNRRMHSAFTVLNH